MADKVVGMETDRRENDGHGRLQLLLIVIFGNFMTVRYWQTVTVLNIA